MLSILVPGGLTVEGKVFLTAKVELIPVQLLLMVVVTIMGFPPPRRSAAMKDSSSLMRLQRG